MRNMVAVVPLVKTFKNQEVFAGAHREIFTAIFTRDKTVAM